MKNKFLKKASLLLLVVFASTFITQYNLCAQQQKSIVAGYIPKNGFVPDKGTALKIALAVWLPIYGNAIYKEQPFNAVLKDEVWTVTGSLPKGSIGGVALIRIQKKDGKVLRVTHGK
ncbi:MAG TPA: YbbC/YhhH family protein [Nostocaceae cyanobacterium]|nr:YbbC/YhhH family protein [Nostocaceae cyanobacterium]